MQQHDCRPSRLHTSLTYAGFAIFALALFAFLIGFSAHAQSNSGSLHGTVSDPTGAVIPGATVTITNTVSGYTRTTKSDDAGTFQFPNVPFNNYTVNAKMPGFAVARQELRISSSVPATLALTMPIGLATETVEVDAPVDLVESDANMHTDVDRSTIDHMPLESASSELSSIVTLASPGVASDSNGMMHGLGDHAENSFNIDGQPITDQQSKVFSNQVPAAAVQSLEVIEGAPPAEYGDKTSLVIKATTRSGQGVTRPTGTVTLSYGSFGSSNVAVDVAYGGKNWGNFIAANGLQAGRFLDAPEFAVFHDKGNEQNFFDRVDFQLSTKDSLHFNAQYTRSWFQTPNDFANLGSINGNGNGDTDQRSKIGTIDFSPTYTRVINNDTVANLGVYVRRDGYNYYPSNNPLADYVQSQQQESVKQDRSLMNLGAHGDVSYSHGIHNAKAGFFYSQTLLRENDYIGIVDPTLTASSPTPGVLLPYDLTAGGSYYGWHGRAAVKQVALYAQDQIKVGGWLFNVGARGDFYNGLTIQRQGEPRLGASYTFKKTGTVLRTSYARTQETPFNENLVLSSTGCADAVLYAIFSATGGECAAQAVTPFNPGFRNEFHAGVQQGVGRHVVFSGDYIWKYTHNAYDFSVLGTTPITFPIEWHSSKIPGYVLSATLTPIHGFSARVNASSVAARFFSPQLGGVGAVPVSAGAATGYVPFRIDHDEKFNQTTHIEYAMPFKKSLYYSFNWRYDSGLVAGATPCYNPNGANTDCDPATAIVVAGQPGIDLSGFNADQEFQAGLACNGVKATPTQGFTKCTVAGLTSSLLKIPAINTEDADKNPSRVLSRNLFDMALGDDDLFHFGAEKRYKIAARLTAINVTNKYGLYNFLSTFSGTHYVTPRTVTAEMSLHF